MTPAPDSPWPCEVPTGDDFARTPAAHPFAARIARLVADDAWRAALCRGFEAHLRARRIGLRGYADSSDRVTAFTAGLAEREPRPVSMVFRAFKKAVYQRTADILDRDLPGWRPRARAETGLRVLGLAPADGEGLAGYPLAREWLWYHPLWIEPVGVDLHQDEAQRRRDAAVTDQPDPAYKHRLAALLERSCDDLLRSGGLGEVHDHLVDQILTESLLDAVAPPPGYAPYREVLVKARKVNQSATAAPAAALPNPAPLNPALRDRRTADEFRDRLAVYRASGSDEAPAWLLDHESLHDTVAALVRSREFGAEKADLAGTLARLAARGALHPRDVKGVFGTLNYLAVHMTNAGIPFPADFTGSLGALALADNGPFTGALLRVQALLESKRHRYGAAKVWLDASRGYLDRWSGAWTAAEADAVAFAEADQQVWLAAGGTELRLLEYHLSYPFLGAARLSPERLTPLVRQGRRALDAAAQGVGKLEHLTREHGLPAAKRHDRASTAKWKIAAQIMFVRALLLQATVDAVCLDVHRATGTRTADREETERSVGLLLGAAKLEYAMLTENRLEPAHMPTLTQLAMHYAFLNGSRLMRPGGNPANLRLMPAFLTTARDGALDLKAATSFLVAKGWNAGILASITSPQIIATLARRSAPDALRARFPEDRQLIAASPYRMWRTENREEAALMRDLTIGRSPLRR
ncbi:hypothetical protein ACFQS3_06945 [Glycomyces mayteni]|uniref:Uncharacterized protein n=1 Tax=Glycomyces mayteni TaxID=543887 RepID=A0ABW2D618_9ACTN